MIPIHRTGVPRVPVLLEYHVSQSCRRHNHEPPICHAGAYHSFVLTHTSNVYACGLNNMGQLGLGSLEPGHTGTPTLITALEGKGVVTLAAGAL